MTVEEFKRQWENRGQETPDSWLGSIRNLCSGDWAYGAYNGNTLLVRCKGYFDTDSNSVVKLVEPIPPEGQKRHLVQMLERWFIVQKDGRRELWSGHRIRDTFGSDHGAPFKMLYDIGNLSVEQVIGLIEDGSYVNWSQTQDKAPKTYIKQEKYSAGTIGDCDISKEYDGVSILALMAQRPKGTYNYFLNMILHEGGLVDENGIIHKKPEA